MQSASCRTRRVLSLAEDVHLHQSRCLNAQPPSELRRDGESLVGAAAILMGITIN